MKYNWAKMLSFVRNNPYAKGGNITRQAAAEDFGGTAFVEMLRALAISAENPFTEKYANEDTQKILLEKQPEFAASLRRKSLIEKAIAAGLRNPWIPAGGNLSVAKQMEIEARSPELAKALKEQAREFGFPVPELPEASTEDVLDKLFNRGQEH